MSTTLFNGGAWSASGYVKNNPFNYDNPNQVHESVYQSINTLRNQNDQLTQKLVFMENQVKSLQDLVFSLQNMVNHMALKSNQEKIPDHPPPEYQEPGSNQVQKPIPIPKPYVGGRGCGL